jgi:hypothetical protein
MVVVSAVVVVVVVVLVVVVLVVVMVVTIVVAIFPRSVKVTHEAPYGRAHRSFPRTT